MPEILGLGQEMYKMGLEYLVVPESKKAGEAVIGYVKGTPKPTKRVPSGQSWNNLSNKTNNVALDYKV